MTKQFACGAVVPDCDFEAGAQTEEELLKLVGTHASDAHGVKELTPELVAQVKAAIRTR